MILAIDNNDGIIKIGSPPEELPGIVESVSVNGSLLIDSKPVQGSSGKAKTVQGWDDAGFTIKLSLIDDPELGKTRWDFLRQIANVFQKIDKDGKPEIYTVSHPMAAAWGAARFLFESMESSESRTKRKITVSLEFTEYESSARITQGRQSGAQAAPAKPAAPPVSDQQRRGLGTLENRFGK